LIGPLAFADPDAAREWLSRFYRRDLTEGQPVALCPGVEKETLLSRRMSEGRIYPPRVLVVCNCRRRLELKQMSVRAMRLVQSERCLASLPRTVSAPGSPSPVMWSEAPDCR
jgi:hypothetical protein